MRKGHLIWILSLALLSGIAQHTSAQWEMIGPDGSPDDILKIDSLLYGITKYGFYQSSDDGRSWTRVEKGLHKRYGHHFDFHYDGFDLYMPAAPFSEGGLDRGFYILDQKSQEWKYADSTHDKLYNSFTTRISKDSFLTILPNYMISDTSGSDTAAVYLTTDRGATWIKRSPPNKTAICAQYIDNRIFVTTDTHGVQYSLKLMYSDDYGVTWKENDLHISIPADIQLFGPFPGFIMGVISLGFKPELLWSTDRGDTWHMPEDNFEKNVRILSGVRVDNLALLTTSSNKMLISSDSGKYWYPLKTNDGEFIYRIFRNNAGNGYIAMVSNLEQGVWQLCELDTTFRIVTQIENRGFTTTDHWLLHATDSLVIVLGASFLNRETSAVDSVLVSTDRGDSWSTRIVTAPGLGIRLFPWEQGEKYLFALGHPDTGKYSFVRSSDQGLHWEDITPEQPIFDLPQILAVTNDSIFVRYMNNVEQQYRISTDAGTTWRVIQALSTTGINGACFLNGYLYEMHRPLKDELHRTMNGIVWEYVTLPPNNHSFIEFPGIIFGLDGVLFVSGGSYSSSLGKYIYHLYRSTDGGGSWTDVNEQIDLWSWDIHMVHKGSMMYLISMGDHFGGPPGGHPKLYSSSDRGATWGSMDNSIPEGDLLFATNNDLFASSWQGGIYRHKRAAVTVAKVRRANESVTVFPNPATQHITVSHSIHEPGYYTYSIVGMTGNITSTRSNFIGEIGEAVFDLSVAELPSGIYCARITGAGTVQQTLFTVQR